MLQQDDSTPESTQKMSRKMSLDQSHSSVPIVRQNHVDGDLNEEEQRLHEEVEYINSVNKIQQPGSEWKLEQGLAAHELPVLDQTLHKDDIKAQSQSEGPGSVGSNIIDVDTARVGMVNQKYDPSVVFAEEKEGWRGYGTYCTICLHQAFLLT